VVHDQLHDDDFIVHGLYGVAGEKLPLSNENKLKREYNDDDDDENPYFARSVV
jgi:hypothetical protein